MTLQGYLQINVYALRAYIVDLRNLLDESEIA